MGYKLDTTNSDNEIVVIDSNDEVIRIYYVKDNNVTANMYYPTTITLQSIDDYDIDWNYTLPQLLQYTNTTP